MTDTARNPGQLLSVETVAQRLDLGVVTIRRMIKRGELPAVRLGQNTVRIKQDDLEAFLESRKAA